MQKGGGICRGPPLKRPPAAKAAAPAQAEAGRSNRQFKAITWNCGSISTQRASIISLLHVEAPSLLFLQECHMRNGAQHAWKANAREMGYVFYHHKSGDLGVFARRGLNFAPLAPEEGDESFTLARYALALGNARVLVRHRHADPSSAKKRKDLDQHVFGEDRGELYMDFGDFNEKFEAKLGAEPVWPDEHTYRRKGTDEVWMTSIDGMATSPLIAAVATARGLAPVKNAQHRPVVVNIDASVITAESWRWRQGVPEPSMPWQTGDKADFGAAIAAKDIDKAWEVWFRAAGCARPSFHLQPENGAWKVGKAYQKLSDIWKRVRRLRHTGTVVNDVKADELLVDAAAIIEEADVERLDAWTEKVKSRSGAATWVKNRMATRKEAPAMKLDEAALSPDATAEEAARSFAERWNAGAYTFERSGRSSTKTSGQQPELQEQEAEPEPRHMEPIDLAAFRGIPIYEAPAKWTAAEILVALPGGAPGPDAVAGGWLAEIHFDAIDRLAVLLNEADRGRTPKFWRQARVALIPKEGTHELRPITVMSVLYRVWASRHASHISRWMSIWAPKGLRGAMPGRSAATTAWEAAGRVDAVRAGDICPQCIMVLDQRQCFDRLHTKNFVAIAKTLGIDALEHALEIYLELERHLYIDYSPTKWVLKGKGLTGIPQGCPLACVICNLSAIVWLHEVEKAIEKTPEDDAVAFSFLDDRLVFAPDWKILNDIFEATKKVDLTLGPELNLKKCSLAFAKPMGSKLRKVPKEMLKGLTFTSAFKYLGIDILVHRNSRRATTHRRVKDFVERCGFIAKLPAKQRGPLTCDAVSAMWLAAGTTCSIRQATCMVGHAARALQGVKRGHGKERIRSTSAVHLCEMAAHRTHLQLATLYAWVTGIWKMLATGIWKKQNWESLYEGREKAIAGPAAQICQVMKQLQLEWESPFRLKIHFAYFDFGFADSVFEGASPAAAKAILAKPEVKKRTHELHVYLRAILASKMAKDRPKDYEGLERGWDDRKQMRAIVYEAWKTPGGPSVLAAGVWTREKVSRCARLGQDVLPKCPRCGAEHEYLRHRLWECPANQPYKARLAEQVALASESPEAACERLYAELPVCALRCGLFPDESDIGSKKAEAIASYLCEVNYAASEAAAAERAGRDPVYAPPGAHAGTGKLHLAAQEAPPLRRKHWSYAEQQCKIGAEPTDELENLTVATDGSAAHEAAGWGFCLARPTGAGLGIKVASFFGPVLGTKLTNNVAELSAIAGALAQLQKSEDPCSVDILYDSQWAANVARRKWKGRTNRALASRVQRLLQQVVMAGFDLRWHHVRAHRGHFLNEQADQAADKGALACAKFPAEWAEANFSPLHAVKCEDSEGVMKRRLAAAAAAVHGGA